MKVDFVYVYIYSLEERIQISRLRATRKPNRSLQGNFQGLSRIHLDSFFSRISSSSPNSSTNAICNRVLRLRGKKKAIGLNSRRCRCEFLKIHRNTSSVSEVLKKRIEYKQNKNTKIKEASDSFIVSKHAEQNETLSLTHHCSVCIERDWKTSQRQWIPESRSNSSSISMFSATTARSSS